MDMKSKKCSVFVWIGKKPKAYLVMLDAMQQQNVLDLISQLHGGTVQAYPDSFDSMELVKQ